MNRSFRITCRSDKLMITLLTVLIIGYSVSSGSVQNGFARKVSVVTVSESSAIITVHYINVGQGDSILIDTPDKDVLIDGGPTDEGQTVVNYLGSFGITHIFLVIATHVHEDHVGGLVAVLSSLTVDQVLINGQTSNSTTYTDFMKLAQSHVITVAQRGQTYTIAEAVNLTVFNPVQPLQFADPNDNSIVVKLQAGSTSFLFEGDAEAAAEQSMLVAGLNLQSKVLKVGHHGSNTSTTQPFLDTVAPEYAIISAGKNDSYGHPSPQTVQKLLNKGVILYGTFQSGTIVASTDGASIAFRDNPQQIPEIHSSIALPMFMMATLLTAIVYAKKRST